MGPPGRGEVEDWVDDGEDPRTLDRALAALRDAQEHWRLVLETANDAFVGIDQASRVIDWNRRAEEMFGWRRDEALGRPITQTIIPPEYRDQHLAGMRRFLATGEGPVLFQRIELAALRRDGTQFPVELTIWPSRTGDEHRFNAFIRDISARRRTEALIDLTQRVTLAANASTDVGSVIRTGIEQVCLALGWPVGHAYLVREADDDAVLESSAWWHVDGPEFDAFHRRTEATRFELGEGLPGRVAASGRPAWVADLGSDADFPRRDEARACGLVSGVAFPVLVGDEVVAVLEFFSRHGTPSDDELLEAMATIGSELGRVFERERSARELGRVNDELRASIDSKSHFLSIVSHELRSPLATISGYADLLAEAWDDIGAADRDEYLASVRRQADRLRRLVGDLLTVSRLDAGVMDPDAVPVEVRDVVQEVLVDLDRPDVEVVAPASAPAFADRDHLARMLVNYLSNALAYGEPPISVRVGVGPDAVEVRVTDAGPGVPTEFVDDLFEAFTRSPGRAPTGTGLGLSIVRGLARANRGDAWYESGAGATFAFRVPTGP